MTNGQDTWRARYAETHTPGSEGGPGKRTDGNTGTAPGAYLTGLDDRWHERITSHGLICSSMQARNRLFHADLTVQASHNYRVIEP